MYNKSSGSMYEELENTRLKKEHKIKVIVRRVIVIIVLGLIVVYLGLLLNDIKRYHNGLLPLIITNTSVKEYDDGTVTTYSSIGWVFRFYQRETIEDSEIAPIWSSIKMDNVLKRINDPNLPEVETDYTVPLNYNNDEQVNNVLFFYDKDKNLLGTYACLLSEDDCQISYSTSNADDLNKVKMGIIDNRYVFITEYKNRDTSAEEKHVYLYDINAKRIIAEYQDVHYTTINDDDNKGYIDSAKYIVKKNNLWGIDQVIKGQVTNFLDYTFNYIGYDADSKLYIMQNTSSNWLAFNANDKNFTGEIQNQIRKIYVKNSKIYFLTYDVNYSKTYNYKLYSSDGLNVLVKDNIDNLVAYDNFLTYTDEDLLYIIDYDGNQVINPIKLYFNGYSSYLVKPFTIKEEGNTLVISTPQSNSSTHYTDEYYYDMSTWAQLKVRTNVKESAS
jgi:hypothetical protein